ncbi:GrpB family protein [Virgibacillus kekensis]|uniref:GrpB family protein n=1 Tax=Virgibacillus kekensis TaxID=202261 RepID=A0ABV9DK80_9BACI
MRRVEVESYNYQWPAMFEKEATKLRAVFGNELVAIHHIGSTSVIGLAAKPVIDIMPVVRVIEQVDFYNGEMEEIGYEAKGENGIPGRRYFQKGGENRTHHVHVFEEGIRHVERHLAFRDYLRKHPNAAKEYSDLKRELAKRYPSDMESYIIGKNHLVLTLEEAAVKWYQEVK